MARARGFGRSVLGIDRAHFSSAPFRKTKKFKTRGRHQFALHRVVARRHPGNLRGQWVITPRHVIDTKAAGVLPWFNLPPAGAGKGSQKK